MIHILFVIMIGMNETVAFPHSMHITMESCFLEHDKIINEIGKPIVNYRPVCVATDRFIAAEAPQNGE